MGVISTGLNKAKERTSIIDQEIENKKKAKSEENARRINAAKQKLEALMVGGESKSSSDDYIEPIKTDSNKNESKMLLYVAGRANKKKHVYKTKGFYILKSLDDEVKRFCSGGELAVYNKLIHLGLESIRNSSDTVFSNVSDLEDLFD